METVRIICLLVFLGFSCTSARTDSCQTTTFSLSSLCRCDGDSIISCNSKTIGMFQTLDLYNLRANKIATNFQVHGKIEAISIAGCPNLEPKSIGTLISKYGGTFQKLDLMYLFDKVALSDGPLDLSGYASPATQMQLNNLNNMQLQLPNVLLLDKVEPFNFKIETVAVTNREVNFVVNEQANGAVWWGVTNILPKIYSLKVNGKVNDQTFPIDISFSEGSQFILKETLYYYPQIKLKLDMGVVRIEYGTVTNGNKVKPGMMSSSEEATLFEEGKCTQLRKDIAMCVICYMHQYQLHRTNDNLESKCLNNQKVTSSMKKCYWRSLVAPSKTVTDKYEVVIPPVAAVKVCDDLPQDIKDYLAGTSPINPPNSPPNNPPNNPSNNPPSNPPNNPPNNPPITPDINGNDGTNPVPNPHYPDNDQEDNGNETTSSVSAIDDDAWFFWLWFLVSLGYINVQG